jgi:hypothetical protein
MTSTLTLLRVNLRVATGGSTLGRLAAAAFLLPFLALIDANDDPATAAKLFMEAALRDLAIALLLLTAGSTNSLLVETDDGIADWRGGGTSGFLAFGFFDDSGTGAGKRLSSIPALLALTRLA